MEVPNLARAVADTDMEVQSLARVALFHHHAIIKVSAKARVVNQMVQPRVVNQNV